MAVLAAASCPAAPASTVCMAQPCTKKHRQGLFYATQSNKILYGAALHNAAQQNDVEGIATVVLGQQ